MTKSIHLRSPSKNMLQNNVHDFSQNIEDSVKDLESLRQINLQDERAFINFTKKRGIRGVTPEDLRDFNKRGWLPCDGTSHNGGMLFHPFRMYTIFKATEVCRLNITPTSTLQQDGFMEFIHKVLAMKPSIEKIGELTRKWNKAINLAILLEPIYWPSIRGRLSIRGIRENDYKFLLEQYTQKTLQLVSSLDPTDWRKIHESLRFDAEQIDSNSSLYLMLRLSNWTHREKLEGHIAGAMWLRHIAEVIRRAFENVTNEQWPEEDEASGIWFPGGRMGVYGSERPLDDELKSKPYIALSYGLFTGSVVRWYVEGDTEYYAIRYTLPDLSKSGIELTNLRGNIKTGKQNVALKLRDCLEEDRAHRRFSIISFDTDVPENVKAIRRHVESNNIIGFIAAHKPDFEFSNFTITELTEIAAKLDEANGSTGDAVRNADWTSVNTAKEFEERYKNVSSRKPRSLKGQEWGEALALYAIQHPNCGDNETERPFWREIRASLQAQIADYDLQKTNFSFNPETFEQIEI